MSVGVRVIAKRLKTTWPSCGTTTHAMRIEVLSTDSASTRFVRRPYVDIVRSLREGNVQFLAHFDSRIASRWKGGPGPPRDDSSCRDKKHTGGRPCPNAVSIAWALLSAVGHLLLRYRSVWGDASGWCRHPVEAISRPLAVGIWLESIHIYSPYD